MKKKIPNQQGGRSMFSGANAQALAALSLFLQHLKQEKFSYIHLEAAKFEDFNLVFEDGRKIVCESKAWKSTISYPQLKNILKSIASKNAITPKDEILIICPRANQAMTWEIEHLAFFDDIVERFKKHGFSREETALLSSVKFWEVEQEFNQMAIYSLFSELINFWLPQVEIERIVDSILHKKIFLGSQKGDIYTRKDILNETKQLAEKARNDSVHYDSEKKQREDLFNQLVQALKDPDHSGWKPKELSALSTDYEMLSYTKNWLSEQVGNLDLEKWNHIWQLNRLYPLSYGVYKTFENNLHTDKNVSFVMSYIKENIGSLRKFYNDDFLPLDIVKTISKIIDQPNGASHLDSAFEIITSLINQKESYYLESHRKGRGSWEMKEICDLLKTIYEKAGCDLKSKVVEFIFQSFDFTHDDSRIGNKTPRNIYAIAFLYINEDFKVRFPKFIKLIVKQYDVYYKRLGKKLKFNGWEYSGGGISFAGSHCSISDRCFIEYIIEPSLRNFYNSDKVESWNFIKAKYVSIEKKVSRTRPDFLNRSLHKILLERYADNNKSISNEAFGILKELLLEKKGIPNKRDIIYQSLSNCTINNELKWKLIEITTKKYGLPVNPFVEKTVSGLARSGFEPAKLELEKWYKNSDYYTERTIKPTITENIYSLLEADLPLAIKLLKAMIANERIRTSASDKADYFGSFEIANILHAVLTKNYAEGIKIIRSLEAEKTLSTQQQVIYAFSLFHHSGNDDSDSIEMLLNIYRDIIDPFLTICHNDVREVHQRMPWDTCRCAFVQFAERLAKKSHIKDALRILNVFIKDQDPYMPGKDTNDPKDEHNEHQKIERGEGSPVITSVRGWCGWVLAQCVVLSGRNELKEVIRLTRILVLDENYYAMHMGCGALAQLMSNRLSSLPDTNGEVLFFSDNKRTALEMAKEVEAIAFIALDRYLKFPKLPQKALVDSILRVLIHLKALNEKDALRLVTSVVDLPDEEEGDAASIFIFFAEFRKDAYKEWKHTLPGLYDDLAPELFDQKKFKSILLDTIHKLQSSNPDRCFKFASVIEHLLREPPIQNQISRYEELGLEYFNILSNIYSHDVFTLIYEVVEKMLNTDQRSDYLDWFNLFIKCLEVEKEFYQEAIKNDDLSKVQWRVASYHSDALISIFNRLGKTDFLKASKIFFSFPEKISLSESDDLVSIILDLVPSDSEAKNIFDIIYKRSPAKYHDYKQKLSLT